MKSISLRIILALFATLIATFIGFESFAAPANSCADLFIDCDKSTLPLPTLGALALEEPEVEAKLSVPDAKTFRKMRELVGQEITVTDPKGQNVVFHIEFNKEHIYKDTYFDIGDSEHLKLFSKGGLLRQRKRLDKEAGEKDFTPRYINFQAKNNSSADAGMNTAVFARNEIRGKKTDKFKKFVDHRADRLAADSKDKAVKYARDIAQSSAKFKEVLFVEQERYFMKVTKKGKPDLAIPAFYVSLDKVGFEGLIGEKRTAKDRFVEIEIIDDLTNDAVNDSTTKLYLLNKLTENLQKRYGLTPAADDKYVTGVKLTVLKQ